MEMLGNSTESYAMFPNNFSVPIDTRRVVWVASAIAEAVSWYRGANEDYGTAMKLTEILGTFFLRVSPA